MANFFSKKLYFQGLKKIKISGIAFSLIIILLNAFVPITGIIDGASFSSMYRGVQPIECGSVVPFCMLIIVLVPILAHDMFSFLNERNQSDFYHSIPQKRTCLYVSFTSAVLTWAFGTILTSTLVNTILWSLARTYSFTFGTIVLGMLPYFVLAVQMAGVMILAMTVTGTKISNFLVAVLFFLFARAMSAFFVIALEEVTPVLNVEHSFFRYFSLQYFLPFALMGGIFDGESDVFVNATLQIYTLIVGVLFLVLGGIAYNKRRSESATRSAPSKLIQHIYRFAVTLPFVFMVAFSMIVDGVEGYQIILVLIAVLVYVLYELITTKKIKNVVKSLPLFAIPVAATVFISVGVFTASNIVNNQKFKAEDIVGYQFIEDYNRSYEYYNTENVFVSNDEAAEILEKSLEDTIDGKYDYGYERTVFENVRIKLKNGRIVARDIRIPYNDHIILGQLLINSPEYSLKFIEIPHFDDVVSVMVYGNYGAGKDKSYELYQCFYDEYNRLSYEDKMAVKYPQGEFNSLVEIAVSGYVGNRLFYSPYHIFYEYMPQTASKYLEILNGDYTYGYCDEFKYNSETIKYYVDQAKQGNLDIAYGKLSFSKATGRFEDGSIEKVYNGDNIKIVSSMSEIFDIILSDKDAFVYDTPEEIYRFNYYLDLNLIEADDGFAYDTDPYIVKDGYESEITGIEYVTSEYSQYFYINQEIYVSINDENIARINEIIKGLN